MTRIVNEYMLGLDVLMNEALTMRCAYGCREADRDTQKAHRFHGLSRALPDYPVGRLTARIREHEGGSSLMTSQP
jgi:hypothetical protein